MKLEPCVIFASGIGMVGKSFTMRELCKLVDNAFHMTMDVINPANLHIPTVSFKRLPKFEDYVANAGGLVSVYDEYENGNLRIKRIEKRVKRIKNTVSKLIKLSKKNKTSPFIEANLLAESIIKKYE